MIKYIKRLSQKNIEELLSEGNFTLRNDSKHNSSIHKTLESYLCFCREKITCDNMTSLAKPEVIELFTPRYTQDFIVTINDFEVFIMPSLSHVDEEFSDLNKYLTDKLRKMFLNNPKYKYDYERDLEEYVSPYENEI